MVEFMREKTAKKDCKYGEYGSFYRLLFLCIIVVINIVISDESDGDHDAYCWCY